MNTTTSTPPVDQPRLVRLPCVALTIKQPWASLIIGGGKDIENRSWPTKFRGPVLIHASKKRDDDELRSFKALKEARGVKPDWKGQPMLWGDVPCGGVIGFADIVDCVTDSGSDWFVGDYGFVLANPRPLPFFECRGALGFWRCEYPDALRAVPLQRLVLPLRGWNSTSMITFTSGSRLMVASACGKTTMNSRLFTVGNSHVSSSCRKRTPMGGRGGKCTI